MRTSWRTLKNRTMTREEQRHARVRAEQDLAQLELAELRAAAQMTQQELADKLQITQVAVSRLERRRDIRLSKLREFVRAIGGELEIQAVFPNRRVRLTHVGEAGRRRTRKHR
jgi:DNA-binding Xre family transcriptional regulator